MSCCGSQRAAIRNGLASSTASAPAAATWSAGALDFEYVGHGQLSVRGPLTGTDYRFAGNGARLRVHAADVPSLVSIPNLRPLR